MLARMAQGNAPTRAADGFGLTMSRSARLPPGGGDAEERDIETEDPGERSFATVAQSGGRARARQALDQLHGRLDAAEVPLHRHGLGVAQIEL